MTNRIGAHKACVGAVWTPTLLAAVGAWLAMLSIHSKQNVSLEGGLEALIIRVSCAMTLLMRTFIARHHMAIGSFLGYGIMGLVFWLAPPWAAMSFAALCVLVVDVWGWRFNRRHEYWPD